MRRARRVRTGPPKLVRAAIGVHCLSAGALAGSPVGKLTSEQLVDARAQLEHEVKRMRGLEDDAAVKRLERDLTAITEEIDRREVCL